MIKLGMSVIGAAFVASAASAATFFGPVHYTSTADTPAGFYDSGATFVEDFEDGTLDGGITASAGGVYGPGGLTDSVDADDGAIDGSGTNGPSYFSGSGSASYCQIWCLRILGQAAIWSWLVASIPSLNVTPVMTLAR